MAYKILWKSGGETAERYSSRTLAEKVLRGSKFSGRVVKVKLGSAGTTSFSTTVKAGKVTGSGIKKLRWIKTPQGVYRKTVVR